SSFVLGHGTNLLLVTQERSPDGGDGALGHCHWPLLRLKRCPGSPQRVDQPSLITPPSVVKPTVGAPGVEQIVWNFSEAVRVSLYPCPNLLARSRASNHEQGHAAPSSHTDA